MQGAAPFYGLAERRGLRHSAGAVGQPTELGVLEYEVINTRLDHTLVDQGD